jgi:1-phosphatidylinositol-4-phosphate 5-kinase
MFKIDAADYMLSLCGDDALRELISPGKSGSVFYLSHDDRFIIKTMKKAEVKVLLGMLSAYHIHVKTYENTLITKFFGLHRIKPYGGQKVRFVVMGNMFCTELRIHRRFDLKGSSQGRSADKVEIDETTTLKDLDLEYEFRLDPSWRDSLLRQLEYDCKFLETRGIMDYSMLLGLHFRAPQYRAPMSPGPSSTPDVPPSESFTSTVDDATGADEDWATTRGLVLVARDNGHGNIGTPGMHIRGSPLRASVAGDPEVDLLLPGTARRLRIQLGVNMPARADRVHKKDYDDLKPSEGHLFGESHDVVLYFGIIDILQNYNLSKRIEHAYKACQFDSISISAVEPKLYSKRFQEFIRQIFPPTQL